MVQDRVHVVSHPLMQHHLGRLREESVKPAEFRLHVRRAATVLAIAATADLMLKATQVKTPLAGMPVNELSQRIGLVPVLRAGLGLVEPFLDLIPDAEVWHLGVYRDERTAQPIEYYCKVPESGPVETGFVLDPMLATGGSAVLALEVMKRWGVPRTVLVTLIAAPEGIATVRAASPETDIFTGAIDERLNDRKFIVPGLGDAGDRLFNTSRHEC